MNRHYSSVRARVAAGRPGIRRALSAPVLVLVVVLSTVFSPGVPSALAGGGPAAWDGGGDGYSWNDPNNWEPDYVPGGSSEVTINPDWGAQVHLESDATIESFRIGQTSYSFLYVTGCTLTVLNTESTIYYSGEVHVQNGAIAGGVTIYNNGVLALDTGSVPLTYNFQEIRAYGPGNHVQQLNNTYGSQIRLIGRSDADNAELTVDSGTLDLSEGSLFLTNDGGLANATLYLPTGNLNVPAGSTVTIDGGGGIRLITASQILNYGTMDLSQPLIALPLLSFFNSGVMTCGAGVQIDLGHFVSNGELYIGQGTEFHVNDGTVSLGGTVSGGGLVASAPPVHLVGTLEPGLPGETGYFHVAGDAQLYPEFRLKVDIGGESPFPEEDRLVVDGASSLDGTLEIDLVDGFVPDVGDIFEVLTCDGLLSGTFASYVGLVQNGVVMTPVYTSHAVLVVVTNVSGSPGEMPGTEPAFSVRSAAGGDTRFDVSLPWNARVEIGIFDVQGRLVDRPESRVLSAGRHEVAWNSRPVRNGAYFVRLAATPTGGGGRSVQRTAGFRLVR